MTNINEYKGKIPTDQEFKQWKSNYVEGNAVPEEIHSYVREVLIPRLDSLGDKIENFMSSKL